MIKTCFSKKLVVPLFNVWLLQEQIQSIHNITAHGTYNLDGYDINAAIHLYGMLVRASRKV